MKSGIYLLIYTSHWPFYKTMKNIMIVIQELTRAAQNLQNN
jgi:hypothetical protein